MNVPPPEPLPDALPTESAPDSPSPPAESAQSALSQPAARQPAISEDGIWAVATALVYIVFYLTTLQIPFGSINVIVLTTLISLLLALLFAVRVSRALRSSTSVAINLVLSGLLAAPLVAIPILGARFPIWQGWRTIMPYYLGYGNAIGLVPGLQGVLMIWFAASLGVWISRIVREVKMLLPISVALACVDIYAVFGTGGLVHTAISKHAAPVHQQAMQSLTVPLATTQTPTRGAAPIQLAVGFADFLFIALFFACMARFGIPARRTFLVLYAILAAYMIVVALGRAEALPALVPIAVVMIGMNLKKFRYERSEAFALLYAALIVAVVAGGFYFFARR